MDVDPTGRPPLNEAGLDLIFRNARSYNAWQPRDLDDAILARLYDLAKWAPTTANTCPGRFVFIRTAEARERLRPHLSAGNVEKTMTAPCCVIVAYDSRFYEWMPKLFPARDFRATFEGKDELIRSTGQRSSDLQGAFLAVAVRALGLDCCPMSGFNAQTLDADFFPDGRWRSNFLMTIGYGADDQLFPRNPRLEFDEACLVL